MNLKALWYQTVDLAFQTKILVIILLGSWVQNGNKLAKNKNNYIIGRSCAKEEIDRKKKEASRRQ